MVFKKLWLNVVKSNHFKTLHKKQSIETHKGNLSSFHMDLFILFNRGVELFILFLPVQFSLIKLKCDGLFCL